MDIISRAIGFASSLEPRFADGLEGSSSSDIQALESAMGRPCSPLYRDFLLAMGESTGSIDLGLYSTRPAELLRFRGEALAALPPGVELLAMPVADDEQDIFLVARPDLSPCIAAHLPLVPGGAAFSPAEANLLAGSMAELLCLPVLNRTHVLDLPFRAVFVAQELQPSYLGHARRLTEVLELIPFWFSSDLAHIAHGEGLIVIAKQTPTSYFSMGIAGDRHDQWVHATRTLERGFADARLALDRSE